MPTVSTDADAYQDLSRIRERINYEGTDFFDDNEQLRFDELLVKFERESRGIFETLWGDQTPLTETGRTDEIRTTYDSAIPLVYPVNDVSEVERKNTLASDWTVVDENWYDWTNHRLVLARRPNVNSMRHSERGNAVARDAERATWRDFATKIRVTYDRGFGEQPPGDILSIQIQLINQLCRQLKREQTVSAASPEEFAGQTETNEVLTDEIRARISDVAKPSLGTFSI